MGQSSRRNCRQTGPARFSSRFNYKVASHNPSPFPDSEKSTKLFFELRIPSLFSFSEKFPCLGNAIQLVPITFRSSPLLSSSSSSSPSLRIKQIVPDIINYNEKYSYEYDITSLIIKGDLLKNDTFTRENTSQLIQ